MTRSAAALFACLLAIPSAEARPRDPVGQFFAGMGKAFAPQRAKRQKTAKAEKGRKGAKTTARRFSASAKPHPTKVGPARFTVKAKPVIPEITVRPLPKELDRYAPSGSTVTGVASWYGHNFHGKPTACGAIAGHTSLYNEWRMTAAHKTLKCGTQVQVHRDGYAPIIVTITDRGPFVGGRIIDLSRKAATDLGMMKSGVAKVTLRVLGPAVGNH